MVHFDGSGCNPRRLRMRSPVSFATLSHSSHPCKRTSCHLQNTLIIMKNKKTTVVAVVDYLRTVVVTCFFLLAGSKISRSGKKIQESWCSDFEV